MNMNVGEINSIEEIEWEEHIQEVTGWSESEVGDMIDEICYENGLHADDDRQEASHLLGIDVLDNARDWLLPKYIKKFEHEIKEHEAFEKHWQSIG